MIFSNAQNILNIETPNELRHQRENNYIVLEDGDTLENIITPMPFEYVSDKDILWSKLVWEVVDMNQKINQPYYYSTDGFVSANKSLYEVLSLGVETKEIERIYDDEYFTKELEGDEMLTRLFRIDSTVYFDLVAQGIRPEPGEGVDKFEIATDLVDMFLVQGLWYIDRRMGELRYRILGIAPMGPDVQTMGTAYEDDSRYPIFWVFYRHARDVLNKYKAFDNSNSSAVLSYDDLLNAKRFDGVMYKTDNGFSDRGIEEYLPKDAEAQLDESQRIHAWILSIENDMWNY